MSTDLLPHICIEPKQPADACVIWLHGLGATGQDFVPAIPYLNLPEDINIRFIFPHAPERAVTINNGFLMPAWYDILSMSLEREVDLPSVLESVAQIHQLIDVEIAKGIDSQRIFLAGFSQGGAVVYQAALTYSKPLAGVLGLSTYVAVPEYAIEHVQAANKDIAVFIAHGSEDDIVLYSLGQHAEQFFKELGHPVSCYTYPLKHEVSVPEFNDIGGWILEHLNKD